MFTLGIILILIVNFIDEHNFCKANPLFLNEGLAAIDDFSFVVSIGSKVNMDRNNPYGHVCGGALITRRYVLTAASCFFENLNHSDYTVYVGSNDLEKTKEYKIWKIVTHDEWMRKRYRCAGEDIAIVELSEDINQRRYRRLRTSDCPPTNFEGQSVTTAGWGPYFNSTFPKYLLKADLKVISNSECIEQIRKKSNDSSYDHGRNFFCTNGDLSITVLEKADRGSPVFTKNVGGKYEMIGINLDAAPEVTSTVDILDQQNKHLSVYYFKTFLRDVTKLSWI